MHFIFIAFIVFLTSGRINGQLDSLEPGSPCTLKDSNAPGTCIAARECEFRKQKPQICRFEGTTAYVCCETKNIISTNGNGGTNCQGVQVGQVPAVPTGVAGEACLKKSTNTVGVCTLANKCNLEFDKNPRPIPQVCSYQKFTPVVCCETKNIIGANTNNCGGGGNGNNGGTTTTTTDKRISERKCDEYKAFMINLLKTEKRIVGGKNATRFEFPHMAAIGWPAKPPNTGTKFHCGGTLISSKFVLTAGHCIPPGNEPEVVRLSEHIFSEETAEEKTYKIIRIIKHPEYRPPVLYNDMALLELEASVSFKSHVRPACLWQTDNPDLATQVTVSGWGKTEFRGKGSDILQKADLNIVANTACTGQFTVNKQIPNGIINTQICLGVPGGGRDTCQGDSGGPAQVQEKLVANEKQSFTYRLVGLTSFGESCGSPKPGVYTRISSYINWIESIVWPNI